MHLKSACLSGFVTIVMSTTIPEESPEAAIAAATAIPPLVAKPKSSGRVVENYPESMLKSFNPIIRAGLSEIPLWDAIDDEFTPNIRGTLLTEKIPLYGEVQLEKLTFVNQYMVEFSIKNHKDLRIVYMHDCDGGSLTITPHPLLKSHWYTAEVAKSGYNITGRFTYVSPPARFPDPGTGNAKTSFNLSLSESTQCRIESGTIRYGLYTIGPKSDNILSVMRARFSMSRNHRFVTGMVLGIEMIQTLKKFHSVNVAICDLNPSIIRMVDRPVMGKPTLVFWGLSACWIRPDGTTDKPAFVISRDHQRTLKSPWELDASASGVAVYTKRDELFRAVQLIALWLSYLEYELIQNIMPLATLRDWKMGGNLFIVPDITGSSVLLDPVAELGLAPHKIASIRASLAIIQRLVRIAPMDSLPYDSIVNEMRSIVRTIQNKDAPIPAESGSEQPTTVSSPMPTKKRSREEDD